MSTIALFGASADPPTLGHQWILRWLSTQFAQVVVWAANNPLKQSHGATLEHRMEMLRRLIAEITPPVNNIQVYPELSSPYTIETVKLAQQRWPQADLTLVVGSDILPQLSRWRQAQMLLTWVKLLVIPRPGYVIMPKTLSQLAQLGATITIADLSGLNISSTAYRESRQSEGLTPAIATYIQKEHLYACQDVTPEN
jgi:nicotinate-nucleotide adenylyltransferase